MGTSLQQKESKGTLRKATELALGAAGVAALVLSFIPEVNLIGAAMQGGITLAQTALDLADGNRKKAAVSFTSGALLTGLFLIPVVGGIAKLAGAGKTAAEVGTEGVESASLLGRMGKSVKSAIESVPGGKSAVRAGAYVKGTAVSAKAYAGAQIVKVPGVSRAMGALKDTESGLVRMSTNKTTIRAGQWVNAHPVVSGVAQAGMMAGGVGLSMVNDTPPGNMLNPKTYDFSNPDAREGHVERERQRRQQQAAATQTVPTAG